MHILRKVIKFNSDIITLSMFKYIKVWKWSIWLVGLVLKKSIKWWFNPISLISVDVIFQFEKKSQ